MDLRKEEGLVLPKEGLVFRQGHAVVLTGFSDETGGMDYRELANYRGITSFRYTRVRRPITPLANLRTAFSRERSILKRKLSSPITLYNEVGCPCAKQDFPNRILNTRL